MSKHTPFLMACTIVLASASAVALQSEETEGMSGMSAGERQALAKPTPYVKLGAAAQKVAQPAPAAVQGFVFGGGPEVTIKGEETEGMSGMSAEERLAIVNPTPYGKTAASEQNVTRPVLALNPIPGGGQAVTITGEETQGMNGMSAEERQTLMYPTPYLKTAALAQKAVPPAPAAKRAIVGGEPAITGEETDGMNAMSADERG